MKGLTYIPSNKDLQKAYELLQFHRPHPPTEKEFATLSQWTRFDPRLAEIWVKAMTSAWQNLNPVMLHNLVLQQPWPAAIAVLFEFVKKFATPKKQFSHWEKTITYDLPLAQYELFFIGHRKVGGQAVFDDARFSTTEYLRWGYLSRESLFNKQKAAPSIPPSISVNTRIEILKSLFEKKSRITIKDYLQAIGACVSKRQAERDLLNCNWIKASGKTRGRFYARKNTNSDS